MSAQAEFGTSFQKWTSVTIICPAITTVRIIQLKRYHSLFLTCIEIDHMSVIYLHLGTPWYWRNSNAVQRNRGGRNTRIRQQHFQLYVDFKSEPYGLQGDSLWIQYERSNGLQRYDTYWIYRCGKDKSISYKLIVVLTKWLQDYWGNLQTCLYCLWYFVLLKISPKFVYRSQTDKKSALAQIMAWQLIC